MKIPNLNKNLTKTYIKISIFFSKTTTDCQKFTILTKKYLFLAKILLENSQWVPKNAIPANKIIAKNTPFHQKIDNSCSKSTQFLSKEPFLSKKYTIFTKNNKCWQKHPFFARDTDFLPGNTQFPVTYISLKKYRFLSKNNQVQRKFSISTNTKNFCQNTQILRNNFLFLSWTYRTIPQSLNIFPNFIQNFFHFTQFFGIYQISINNFAHI